VHTTIYHRLFSLVRERLPAPIARSLRAGATAMLTPLHFTQHTGHWRSSFRSMAVSPSGKPIPWYTYPCIDFLAPRRARIRSVLEFGAGQSTLWWAAQGARVLSFEADRAWYEYLKPRVPSNVDLRFVEASTAESCLRGVNAHLDELDNPRFEAIVVDGLFRAELAALSLSLLAANGVMICDDSEGYQFYETLRDSGLSRVDFFGFAPGVMLARCTSIYFGSSDLFAASVPVSLAPAE
jgi:hypothetical protein